MNSYVSGFMSVYLGIPRLEDEPNVRGRTAPAGFGVRSSPQASDYHVRAYSRRNKRCVLRPGLRQGRCLLADVEIHYQRHNIPTVISPIFESEQVCLSVAYIPIHY